MRQHSVEYKGATIHYADHVVAEKVGFELVGPFRWEIVFGGLGGCELGAAATLGEARRLVDLVVERGLR